MTKLPYSTDYTDKFQGFNQRTLEYIHNSRFYTWNVLEGAVRSSKTVTNCFAASLAIEESTDRIHFAVGFNSKVAIRNIFESDGLGLIYMPHWQGRLSTKALGPGTYILVLDPPPGSNMPVKEIIPIGGGESDSESSFRGMSVGIVIITEANIMHPATLDALEQRTFKADIRRFFVDFNPSSPSNFIYSWLGSKIKRDELPLRPGTEHPVGYNIGKYRVMQYMHSTFNDNMSMDEERVREIMETADPNSAEYKRKVLGLRASGAGKIYHLTDKNELMGQVVRGRYFRWIVVIDPGITISETAFVLMALTNDVDPEVHILSEYSHVNAEEASSAQHKTDGDYAFDSFAFIKQAERTMGTQAWKILCDPAAVSFIREYNRNARMNGVYYPLAPGIKRDIDTRIKIGQSLTYSGRMKFHNFGGQKTRFEFEDAEYDEKKSLKGTYVRLDNPAQGKQIGLIDCVEMGIEAFAFYLFRTQSVVSEAAHRPNHRRGR